MSKQQPFTVNSAQSLKAYKVFCDSEFQKHKHLTFPVPRRGKDRSLDQNSLFHVFCEEVAAHFMGVNRTKVSKHDKNAVKRTMKQMFLQAHPECRNWITCVLTCPITENSKNDFTSSRDWKAGEMFMVLEWMQFHGMSLNPPLHLESKGEFDKKQREQNQ